MGNCFKPYTYQSFDSTLMENLNETQTNNKINSLNDEILGLKTSIKILESKMKILESNTQNNLKTISNDIHFINNTVNQHNNMLNSKYINNNLNPTPLNESADITEGSIYKSVTFQIYQENESDETF